MKDNFFKTQFGKQTVTILSIVISYIIFYGLLVILMNVMNSGGIPFIIFSLICMFFAVKSFKDLLTGILDSFPWWASIILVWLLGVVLGYFVAPYHVGKWVAKKINEKSPFEAMLDSVSSMDLDTAREMYLNLCDIMFEQIRSNAPDDSNIESGEIYCCKTYVQAKILREATQKRVDLLNS